MQGDPINRRSNAAQRFHEARRQAAIEALLGRLTGHSANLLSYEAVADALQVRGQSSAGHHQVPVEAIVGSVGRYNDFTRTFLPLLDADEDRWVSVQMAAEHVGDLPPVELYRIGDAYFVLDGNHRISIARRQRLDYIDAFVTEIRTRVPLPPGADPDALILAAEHAAFLEWSQLDRRRPDIDLRVSVPGQYMHLENHIEAFRFRVEMAEECELDLPDAAVRWYDEAYLPLAEAIREQGILRYFPGRSETDLFIWLAAHRNALHRELGISLTPEATVSKLTDRVQVPDSHAHQSLASRMRRRLTRLAVPEGATERVEELQVQSRTLARYSESLFADILLPLELSAGGLPEVALQQALTVACEEGGRLYVAALVSGPGGAATCGEAIEELKEAVSHRGQSVDVETSVVVDSGDRVTLPNRLCLLYDLIVVDRAFGQADTQAGPSLHLLDLIAACHRPVLVAGPANESVATWRVLMVVDESPQSQEALFVAAYLGEKWKVNLSMVLLGRGRALQAALEHARDYLDMHELQPRIVTVPPGTTTADLPAQLPDADYDLLIIPGIPHQGHGKSQTTQLAALIEQWPHSLLIAAWA